MSNSRKENNGGESEGVSEGVSESEILGESVGESLFESLGVSMVLGLGVGGSADVGGESLIKNEKDSSMDLQLKSSTSSIDKVVKNENVETNVLEERTVREKGVQIEKEVVELVKVTKEVIIEEKRKEEVTTIKKDEIANITENKSASKKFLDITNPFSWQSMTQHKSDKIMAVDIFIEDSDGCEKFGHGEKHGLHENSGDGGVKSGSGREEGVVMIMRVEEWL